MFVYIFVNVIFAILKFQLYGGIGWQWNLNEISCVLSIWGIYLCGYFKSNNADITDTFLSAHFVFVKT